MGLRLLYIKDITGMLNYAAEVYSDETVMEQAAVTKRVLTAIALRLAVRAWSEVSYLDDHCVPALPQRCLLQAARGTGCG